METPTTNTTAAAPGANLLDHYLTLARDAFSASTTFFDASIRREIEANIRQFQGVHPAGSKYHSETYKNRSRLFRPRTRSSVRKHEAVACEAMFSTVDKVVASAQNEAEPQQRAAAKLMKALLEYRLEKSIPWFQIALGGYQEAQVAGSVVGYVYWDYSERRKVDKPCIDLFPLENFRIDPGSDWLDPVGTSPYCIREIPMYVKDVKARARNADPRTGLAKWLPVSDAQLLAARQSGMDSTRNTRERGRTDPKDNATPITEFTVVWVRLYVMDIMGEDFVWYTLSDQAMLTEPVPISEMWWHGVRPFAMGYAALEALKIYPQSPVAAYRDLQAEINETANTRIDNWKFALNRRYFARRNGQVDIRSITRNIPGSVTLMTDIEKDVKVIDTQDVTSSAYQEQDRLNADFDDLSGSFSPSSVMTNRRLNETVGGMNLLTVNTNQVGAYQLKTYVETFLKPLLRLLALNEAHYETDEVVLQLAADRAGLADEFMQDPDTGAVIEGGEGTVDGIPLSYITDELLNQDLTLDLDINYAATNPKERINDLLTALRALKEILMDGVLARHGLRLGEIIKVLFGNLGHNSEKRFFDEKTDPQVLALQATIEDLTRKLEQKVDPALVKKQIEKLDAEISNLGAKNHDILMAALEKAVRALFAAHQTGQMVATVPQVAAVADSVVDSAAIMSGNPPTSGQPIATPAAPLPGFTQDEVQDPRTGIKFVPGAAGDTSPNTPANAEQPAVTPPAAPTPPTPGSPQTGATGGIETTRNEDGTQ